MQVAHGFQDLFDINCFAGVDVDSPKFCFCCACHDLLDYLCDVENGAAIWGKFVIFRHEPVAANTAACVLFVEVASAAVSDKNHATCAIC